MSTGAAQLQFAGELALFLVALGGCLYALLRPDLLVEGAARRLAAGLGFGALAGAAFLHGARVVESADAGGLVALRVAGIALLVPLVIAAAHRPTIRLVSGTAVTVLAVAEVLAAADQQTAGDLLRALGAIGLGAGLVALGRRSISSRIAGGSGAILLAVVLAISLSLSVVISDNVENEARRRFGADANAETRQADAQTDGALSNATLGSEAIANNVAAAANVTVLLDPTSPDDARSTALNQVTGSLEALTTFARDNDPRTGPAVLVGPTGAILARSGDASNSTISALAGSSAVTEALSSGERRKSIVVVDGKAFGVGVQVLSLQPRITSGAVVFTTQLDDTYLRARVEVAHQDVSGYGLTLAGRDQVLAGTGPQPATGAILALSRKVLDGTASIAQLDGDRFVAARAVLAPDGSPVAVFFVSVPGAFIASTRDDVFRALFVAALGSAILALLLASFVGERIGSGVRQLTAAASELRSGNLFATAGLRTADELGVLSSTFDEMTGSIRGMTAELRKAADDETELRARLETVISGMAEAVIAVNERGDVTDFNAAAEGLVQLAGRKAIGRPISRIVRIVDDTGADLSARLAEPVLDGWERSATVHAYDGTEVPVVVAAGSLRGSVGQIVGAVFLLRDMRRELEVERMKNEFIANISDEMRIPLTPIKGYAGMLRTRTVEPAKVKAFASEIENGADQLERVVSQLVNFATMVAGRLDLHRTAVKPRDLLDGVAARWQPRLGAGHTLQRKVQRGTPAFAADRRYLDQAIDELVDNALKYSPTGGRVTLTIGVEPADGVPMVAIAVSDQGVGIAPERMGSIFEDFSQGDGSATRPFRGLGLGLSLVSRIVNAHGGRLECRSVVGKGTRMAVRLPIGEVGDR